MNLQIWKVWTDWMRDLTSFCLYVSRFHIWLSISIRIVRNTIYVFIYTDIYSLYVNVYISRYIRMFSARIMPLSLCLSLSLALSDFMFVNNKQNTVACNDSVCFSSMDSYMTLNLSACGSSCSCVRFVRYLRDCSPRGASLSLSFSHADGAL